MQYNTNGKFKQEDYESKPYLDYLQLFVDLSESTKTNGWTYEELSGQVNAQSFMDLKLVYDGTYFDYRKGFKFGNDTVEEISVFKMKVMERSVKVTFSGIFFENDTLSKDLMQVQKVVDQMFFSKRYFKLMTNVKVYVSRVDIACNLRTEMQNIKFLNPYNSKIDMRETLDEGIKSLVYMYCGSSKSKKSAQLVIYDKRKDSKFKLISALDRFGDYDWCRAEYRIPAQRLRTFGIRYLEDLTVKALYTQFHNEKGAKSWWIKDTKLPVRRRPQLMYRPETSNQYEIIEKMVIGMFRKQSTENCLNIFYNAMKKKMVEDKEIWKSGMRWLENLTGEALYNQRSGYSRGVPKRFIPKLEQK